MMGNRGGALHSEDRKNRAPLQKPGWITCVLNFGDGIAW